MVEQALVQAMHEKRFREELSMLRASGLSDPGDSERLEQLIEALQEFDDSISAATSDLISALRGEELEIGAITDPAQIDGSVTLRIPETAIERMTQALVAQGFNPMYTLSPGAERVRRRVRRTVNLVSPDGPITSVSLRWGGQPGSSVLARLFRPSVPDLAFVPLPSSLWWAYWLVKPLRVLAGLIGLNRAASAGPFLGTPPGLIEPLLELVDLSSDSLFVDLGCGDGRVLVEAARQTGCRARGIESNAALAARAWENAERAGVSDHVEVTVGDFGSLRIDEADVVFAFLPASQLRDVAPSILPRMAPGSTLLAHEQEEVRFETPPTFSRLVVSSHGVTVAHVWKARGDVGKLG